MAGSNKSIDKTPNISAKPGGLTPPKNNQADVVAATKFKGLMDELESKLDDLFASDQKDATDTEKRQVIKSPLVDVKEESIAQKAVAPDKYQSNKIQTKPPTTDSKETAVQKQKQPAVSIKKANPESTDKAMTLKTHPKAAALEKPKPAPEAAPDLKAPITPVAKPAAPPAKKTKATPVDKDVSIQSIEKSERKKFTILHLAACTSILTAGVLAWLIFFQTSEPLHQSRPVAPSPAHKIIKPHVKLSESQTTPQAAASVPVRSETVQIKPEVPSIAIPDDEKKTIQTAKPEMIAAEEIKAFLQEWEAAWEKSAGANGDAVVTVLWGPEGSSE